MTFGDSTFSVLIQGLAPLENKLLSKQIKASILSIVYDKNFKFDYLQNAPFKLESSLFKLANFTGGMYIFTLDGKIPEDDNKQPVIIGICFPNLEGPESIANKNLMEVNDRTPGIFITKKQSTLTINGAEAFESENYATIEGNKQLLYQLAISDKDKVILLQAVAFDHLDENLEKFKKAAYSFKFK